MIGFVKIDRKILDWEWYQDSNVSRVFFHLLIKANFVSKKWRGIEIKRGQLITSSKTLSVELGLSNQKIRTAINKLKSTNEITIKTTNKFSCISIVSYDKFQDINNQGNKQITNKQQTNNKQITTTKESKEYEEVKEKKVQVQDSSFDGFWKEYTPVRSFDGRVVNKGDKQKAKNKYLAILKEGVKSEEIIRGLKNYIADCHKNGFSTCGAQVFLNQRRWEREYEGVVIEPVSRQEEKQGTSLLHCLDSVNLNED